MKNRGAAFAAPRGAVGPRVPRPQDRGGALEGYAVEVLVAQVANHRRNIEVIAEIARRHRPESAAAVASESFTKKGWIVDLTLGSNLRRRRRLFVMRGDLLPAHAHRSRGARCGGHRAR